MQSMDHEGMDGMDGMDGMEGMEGMGHEGMDHGAAMDHGDAGSHETSQPHTHDSVNDPASERPRGLVLGSFAAVNGGVLVTAALLRRRTKGEVERRRAARTAALGNR